MMTSDVISDKVRYIGVNDRRTVRFESMWHLPQGVSYNSYLVTGPEKTAVIDGVDTARGLQQISEIKAILGERCPDYLVINHMEPDHSGAIRLLREAFPGIVIVGNAQTLKMVEGYYGIEADTLAVKDGDTLSLGGDTALRFFLTPMVHWPETMMTWLEDERTLFSGDGFGCFGALNGAVLDTEMDTERYFPEMLRYYSNIVGKYGTFVQRALKKLSDLEIKTICPTHGPVWHERVSEVVSLYDRLSRYEPLDNGVTVICGSMYGNMESYAETAAAALADAGVRRIEFFNAAKDELSDILASVFRHKGLVIAAPTYSDGLFPPVRAAVEAIAVRGVRDRAVALLGTCTWAERATGVMTSILAEGGITPSVAPLVIKQSATADDIRKCRDVMADFANLL